MNSFKVRPRKIIILSIYIILLDQFSKFLVSSKLEFKSSIELISNFIRITLVKNKGAAFSLFSNSTSLLTFISIIATLMLITIIFIHPPKSYLNSIGLGCLLGGTVGNGIDRLLRGYVIDFIELVPINFPIFNIADISINLAIMFFVIDLIITNKKSNLKKFTDQS
tara:strand:- start:4867 stop:5364 length:498 start_codon:yes stop_codon:yes gene_type:complete